MIWLSAPGTPNGLALDLELPGTALALDAIADAQGELWPDEAAAVAPTAAPSRRMEFAAGRTLARRAMAALSLPPAAVPRGVERDPVWPPGMTGSLTHCRHFAAAVASRKLYAVGLDIECVGRLDGGMAEVVLTPDERRLVTGEPLATALFSAKEAAFKAVNPLTRRAGGFQDVEITLDLPARRFIVTYRGRDPANALMDRLEGALSVAENHVLTLAWLRSPPAGGA